MNNKFVPYEKLSKKEKKHIDSLKRSDWKNTNPVTKITKSSKKIYVRKWKID